MGHVITNDNKHHVHGVQTQRDPLVSDLDQDLNLDPVAHYNVVLEIPALLFWCEAAEMQMQKLKNHLHSESGCSFTSIGSLRPGQVSGRSAPTDSLLEFIYLAMRFLLLPLVFGLSPAGLFLLQLPDFTDTQEVHREDYKYGHQDKPLFCSWKCLLLTLQWPGGFCPSLDRKIQCRIPQTVNNWTIHGLWPLRAMKCCDCWPMFHSDVQEVEAELTEHWPSLLKIKSNFNFWRGEWQKHGVCAACVEGMNSPLRYFKISLKLRRQFDIHKLLEDAGITPSCERLYKVEEVHQVLAPHLGDRHEIQCITDEEDREVWFQVKIPLSRNLTVGCDHNGDADSEPATRSGFMRTQSSGHPCPPHVPFYYYPIDPQRPQQPCG